MGVRVGMFLLQSSGGQRQCYLVSASQIYLSELGLLSVFEQKRKKKEVW